MGAPRVARLEAARSAGLTGGRIDAGLWLVGARPLSAAGLAQELSLACDIAQAPCLAPAAEAFLAHASEHSRPALRVQRKRGAWAPDASALTPAAQRLRGR